MLRLIGRERIFRCILRLVLRCGSRLLERLGILRSMLRRVRCMLNSIIINS